tara:strand:+ start:3398 stop:4345 length:948 start_codon:yes stop_codon:yes gene_type:complete
MLNRALALIAAAALTLLSSPAFAQETRSFTDDAGRTVDIPTQPRRIASLQDLFFSVPLIELGVVPAGSHGRSNKDGTPPFMRSSKMMTGVDFDTADIVFLGTGTDIDPEAVAAMAPDLIVLSTNQDPELFAKIAPTILLDFNRSDKFELYERLAEITGTEANLALLETRYQAQLAQVRAVADTTQSVNVIAAFEGQIRSYRHFAALGRILDEAGFAMPDAVKDIPYGQYDEFSPELLPQMDADLVLVTYRAEQGETAQDAYDQLEATVPGFCSFLTACQEGRMIAIPRDETFVSSYNALGALAYTVIALTTPPAR